MPRFDLDTLRVNDKGSINLADLRVTGQRNAEKRSVEVHKNSRWRLILRNINKDLIKTADRFLVEKDNHREEVLQQARRIIERMSLTSQEKAEAFERIEAELYGFGILDKHIKNNKITEIIIDAPDKIDVELGGVLYRLGENAPFEKDEVFDDDEELQQWTDNLMRMAKAERSLNYGNPRVNVELANGERVEATCPPITEHITVNIRKSVKQTKKYLASDQIAMGSATKIMVEFLIAALRGKANLLLLGGTGTGKTTWVRTLMEDGGIDPEERVLMIEDVRETNASLKRFLSMQTVTQGQNKIDMVALFEECMRKRPDRVCVSEIRGVEAAVFLTTSAAGHDGAITTMHAGEPEDAVFLLIMRMRQAGYDMSEQFLERFIHGQVHIMAFISRTRDGRRRLSRIVEVNPLDRPNVPKFRDIFLWDPLTDTFEWVNDIEPDKRRKWTINGADVPIFPGKESETSVVAG